MRPQLRILVPFALVASLLLPATGSAQACGMTTAPTYRAGITSPQGHIPTFPDVRVTTAQANSYQLLLTQQSDHVVSQQFGTSNNGTPMYYSFIGRPENLAKLDEINARQKALRDPRVTTEAEAQAIAGQGPMIIWHIANVHGLETSGTDGALSLMYDLAARTDCLIQRMLDNLVVGFMPLQNPDGRDAVARTNIYNFDLNRDWFARSQVEMRSKFPVLAQYPATLIIDAHEQGSSDFWFPPNNDPIYHENPEIGLRWLNEYYGAEIAREFDRRKTTDPTHWDHSHYSTYDLFCMCRMTPFTASGFNNAGLLFEKGAADPDRIRWEEQYVAGLVAFDQSAIHRQDMMFDWWRSHKEALDQGKQGLLEPNFVQAPGNTVEQPVPDMRIRNYFIENTRARSDVLRLVTRLQEMNVEVYRLAKKTKVPALGGYGEPHRRQKLAKGTFWIPMAQPQKRYIQAVLHEQPWPAVPEFYDVTAWSNALLLNVDASFTAAPVKRKAKLLTGNPGGGLTGKKAKKRGTLWFHGDTSWAVAAAFALSRDGVPVHRLTAPMGKKKKGRIPAGAFVTPGRQPNRAKVLKVAGEYLLPVRWAKGKKYAAGTPVKQPRIAVYSTPSSGESQGHLEYLLTQAWKVPFTLVTAAQVAGGALSSYDVFVVPGENTSDLNPAANQVRSWIQAGGTYVGYNRGSGGTSYAVANGFTSSRQSSASAMDIPGTLFKVNVQKGSPLTLGAGPVAYWYHQQEQILSPSTTGINAGVFASPGWFSGYATGSERLAGSAAMVDEALGTGRVLLFTSEMNFRAWTDGTAFLLANAIAYPEKAPAPRLNLASRQARPQLRAAMRSSLPEVSAPPMRFRVPLGQTADALQVLGRFPTTVEVVRSGATNLLEVANPMALDVHSHPFARELLPALHEAGIDVRYAAVL